MFCTNCGSQLQTGTSFCVQCGQKVNSETPSPVASVPEVKKHTQSFLPSTAPATVSTAAPIATGKCPSCGAAVSLAAGSSCPQCGAIIRAGSVTSASGWMELPPRRDMAKLQFGNSSCQIEGLYVPVAEMNLASEDSVYFTHHVLLWMDSQVHITAMPMKGGWKRLFAGMPLIMTQAQGPGHIAFSKDLPGELIALPLHPGQSVDVREHMFLTATSNVEYDWFHTQVWYRVQEGNDTATHYPIGMFMDRFASPAAPGLLLLHAGGSVFVRELAPGQTVLVKPSALVFKDPGVEMELHFEHPAPTGIQWFSSWTNRSIWLRLTGPGRVAIQSVFERAEGEGSSIVGHSYATTWQW